MVSNFSSNPQIQADDLKAQGNELYKAGDLTAAIKLYNAAVLLQPEVPVRALNACTIRETDETLTPLIPSKVYLSNLSAAQVG